MTWGPCTMINLSNMLTLMIKGLVTNYGEGGLQNGRGGPREVLPLRKGGSEKVLAMLKGGHTKF